jgi:hypothetical protein
VSPPSDALGGTTRRDLRQHFGVALPAGNLTTAAIVAITHHKGKRSCRPGRLGAAEGPRYYTSEVGLETIVTKITEIWEIQVKMRTGKIHVIQQDFQPLLQVGDPVLVDRNSLQLWN